MNKYERAAVQRVLDAYQQYLDTDDLDVLRDSLTLLSEATGVTASEAATS
jgi:hypothetical protein